MAKTPDTGRAASVPAVLRFPPDKRATAEASLQYARPVWKPLDSPLAASVFSWFNEWHGVCTK